MNDSDGALYLSHFLSAGDAIKVLQASPDTPLANLVSPQSLAANPKVFAANKTAADLGTWAVRKVGAAGASSAEIWFDESRQEQVNRFQGYLKEQAGEYVGTFERALGKGIDPSPQWLQSIHDVLDLNGSPELRQRVETALQAHYNVERLDQLPANVRQSFVGQLKDQAGESPVAFQVHQHMEDTINGQIKGMVDAPYTTAYARHLAPAPEAYDFGNPNQVSVVAANRATQQQQFRNLDKTPPVSVFEGAEGEAFKNTIVRGDPKVAAATLSNLAQVLPADVFQATMTSGPARQGLQAAADSNDPIRMNVAMSTLDTLWRASPITFGNNPEGGGFGKATLDRLQEWQGLKDSFEPPEIAKMMSYGDDPAAAKARQERKADAEKEVGSVTTQAVSNMLGSWSDRWLPFVNQAPPIDASSGKPPGFGDGQAANTMKNEYANIYVGLRTSGVPQDQAASLALKRLQTSWGPSDVAGGAIMKYPPEFYAKPINGTKDWMRQQIDEDLTKALGPAVTTNMQEFGAVQAPRVNWSFVGLIPDTGTQAEIFAGKPPHYQVAIQDDRGMVQIVPGRFHFDRSPYLSDAEHQWEVMDQYVKARRAAVAPSVWRAGMMY